MKDLMFKMAYTTDLLIFGIDSRKNRNTRGLPKKYFSILLVKRDKEPFKDKWSLPGGFVELDESSRDASLRILEKETGLKNVYMQKLTFKDDVNRDSRGRIVSSSYMALIDRTLLKNELSLNACWFDIIIQEVSNRIIVNLTNGVETISYRVNKEVIDSKSDEYNYVVTSLNPLAFDHDELIVEGAMELRNKVRNTDIVFNLMPEEFTIGEVKQVYELLLNKKLINSVFRRSMASKFVVTDKKVKTGGHRPSLICRYNDKQDK